MRVVCVIEEILEQRGLTKDQVCKEVGIRLNQLQKLLEDKDWQLKRSTLYNLMLWAKDHGYPNGIFEFRPMPIWGHFPGQKVRIYREERPWDSHIENYLQGSMRRIGATAQLRILGIQNLSPEARIAQVKEDMKNCNCIFLGSPKYSLGTEIALSLLWDAEPFNPKESNRQRIPIRFCGMEPKHNEGASSMLEHPSRFQGFRLHLKDRTTRDIKVDRRSLDEYQKFDGEARDAALALVCHRPLGTKENVTTIVAAGYTGLATSLVMDQLIHHETPFEADSKEPILSLFKFRYEKSPHQGTDAKIGVLRRPIEESFSWERAYPASKLLS